MWAVTTAAIVSIISFFAWVVNKIFGLQRQIDQLSSLEKGLSEIKQEQRDTRKCVNAGFRAVNQRLDQKVDRRNGTG